MVGNVQSGDFSAKEAQLGDLCKRLVCGAVLICFNAWSAIYGCNIIYVLLCIFIKAEKDLGYFRGIVNEAAFCAEGSRATSGGSLQPVCLF